MFKGGMGNIMKQAQQMQDKMQKMQEEIAKMEVVGESGAGLVKVTMLGSHSVKRVELDESLMEDDKDMIEDLLAAAVNDAVRRVEEMNKDQMGKLTGGMGMPPGMKMPFQPKPIEIIDSFLPPNERGYIGARPNIKNSGQKCSEFFVWVLDLKVTKI